MKIQNYHKKLSKYESQIAHQEQMKQVFYGEGVYLFRNRTKGDLRLAKAANRVHLASGDKWPNNSVVPPNGTFEGDSYFMALVPQEAILVKTLVTPQQERDMKMLQEQKLILDQPDQVKSQGKVEHVVSTPTQPLNETPVVNPKDVLLTEDPLEGVQILRD